MAIINFMTVNLLNYDGKDPDQAARYAELAALLRNQNPDILAVQELISSDADTNGAFHHIRRNDAEVALYKLADALSMECTVNLTPALAISTTRHHTGLLWREGIEVVADGLARYDSHVYGISHGLTAAVFRLGGKMLRVGSTHLDHFNPGVSGGLRDVGCVMRAFNRNDGILGIVGGDWQGIGADKTYDPDPYEGKEWDVSHGPHYAPGGEVDRDAAIRLERDGRFRDCARIVGAEWQATTGHHHTDTNQPRRIDRIYVTYNLPDAAVTGYRVVGPDIVGQCTDHCPVVVEIDETKL